MLREVMSVCLRFVYEYLSGEGEEGGRERRRKRRGDKGCTANRK